METVKHIYMRKTNNYFVYMTTILQSVALPGQQLPASREDQLYYRPVPSLYQGFHVFVAPKKLVIFKLLKQNRQKM